MLLQGVWHRTETIKARARPDVRDPLKHGAVVLRDDGAWTIRARYRRSRCQPRLRRSTRCPTCGRCGTWTTARKATNGRTSKLHKLRTLHLFAGAGGGILGDIILGHQCVCAVEIEPYPQQVLSARQRDGLIPWFPIFADVTTFDGRPWNGLVDVVCGGFPCQDISSAGKGAGLAGSRSGLWSHMARIICDVEPRQVLVENSPLLVGRGLDVVLGDLASMGFDARWCVMGAADVGAPHQRDRIWILADAR